MNASNPYQSPTTTSTAAFFDGERSLSWLLFKFNGRVPRRVFWVTGLIMGFVFYAVILGLMAILGRDSPVPGLVTLLLDIPLIWMSLAVQIKRWHDRNKSGWWALINFVPIIGAIWAFVELGCLRGTEGPNQYGADPT